MRMCFVTTTMATLGLAGIAQAQLRVSEGLAIGDQAPQIKVANWVKGEPVEQFQSGHVYVLEFWATWCSPCVVGMPQLSELQSEYADDGVSIIGISDEPPAVIRKFLTQKSPYDGKLNNDRARYALGSDPDRSVFRSYMSAAGETGIPTAFIVGKEGHVEWIGHPAFLKPVLKRVIDEEWDRGVARQIRYELEPRLIRAFTMQKWDEAIQLIDDITELDPARAPEFHAQKFTLLLTETDRIDDAYELGNRLVEQMWNDAHYLNQIAWFVVDNPKVQSRNLDFAMRIAERANELTRSNDAMILDTIARVHFEKGDLRDAIEWQVKAVEHLNATVPPALHTQIRNALRKYRQLDK